MSYLELLIDHKIRELSGAEFKIAVYLYRLLEGQKRVKSNIRRIAKVTGISWRQTQSALKNLAGKSVLGVKSTPKGGTWFWLPAEVKALAKPKPPTAQPEDNKIPAAPVKPAQSKGDMPTQSIPAESPLWRQNKRAR